MSHSIRTLIVICLASAPLLFSKAQALQLSVTASNQLEQIIEQELAQAPRPFFGTILIADHASTQVLINKMASGVSEPVVSEPQYIIGSLSKMITATLVLRAIDQGKLQLNDKVSHYLGDNIHADVTVAGLLSHTSGIRGDAKILTDENAYANKRFQYSNLGYQLLGQLLTAINNRPLAKQVSDFGRQFDLNLHASFGGLKDAQLQNPSLLAGFNEKVAVKPTQTSEDKQLKSDKPNTATYQRSQVESLNFSESELASGFIQTDAASFARFMHLLHTGQLLSSASYQAMTTTYGERKHRWGQLGYGYGVQINKITNGQQLKPIVEYSHSGYVNGFISSSIYYPQSQTSIVILENTSWSLDDISRVFSVHDNIRQQVLQQLIVK
ncbi:serine hydrolase domain-containing protein [Shewanella maritima]|uniref:serine hydrolase domain-containing protein n=1 Tax=Shewanella maritima TaxID=2520507 RepID=UPI0013EE6244|nr:serine hydrolase [Shewanella maritima]